jgi:UDP-glucose 4-epimerase
MTKTIIVTGASGFIGGQTALQLKSAGYHVVGIDLRPATPELLPAFDEFYQGNFSGDVALSIISNYNTSAIVHCAGTSLVGPSMFDPELYYQNNFVRTKVLLDFIVANKLQNQIRVIFSSSASVYGEPVMTPCQEEDPPMPVSPYGDSKLMVEMMLKSYHQAYGLDYVAFRYFNACGADSQARHGQAPGATHIIARVLESIRDSKEFVLNGIDYPTPDGTCVRDYVHVEDIARAHVMALDPVVKSDVYNLGSSTGTSNREIIDAAQQVTGNAVIIQVGQARPGDPPELTASATKFETVAGAWKQYNLSDMIQHAWAWYNK